MTVLPNGTVTCGLDGADGLRSFGNIYEQSLADIFASPDYIRLRNGLRAGRTCRDTALYKPLTAPRPP